MCMGCSFCYSTKFLVSSWTSFWFVIVTMSRTQITSYPNSGQQWWVRNWQILVTRWLSQTFQEHRTPLSNINETYITHIYEMVVQWDVRLGVMLAETAPWTRSGSKSTRRQNSVCFLDGEKAGNGPVGILIWKILWVTSVGNTWNLYQTCWFTIRTVTLEWDRSCIDFKVP